MKKTIKYILILIVISFVISLIFNILFLNYRVINKKSDNRPEIIEIHNMNKEGEKFVSLSDDSYIKIRIKDNYINNINFSYETNDNFYWEYTYNQNNEDIVVGNNSTYLINKAIRKINKSVSELKISVKTTGVKIYDIKVDNDIFINWNIVISVWLFIFLGCFIFIKKKELVKNISKTFLIIGLILGVSLIIVAPKKLNTCNDDQTHYYHVLNPLDKPSIRLSYAEQIVYTNTYIDYDEYILSKQEKFELYKSLNKLHKESKDRVIEKYDDRPFYANIVYLPFYFGYNLGSILNLDFTMCFMLGKLFNLLVYLFMFYVAIKDAKYGKKLLFIIGLLPSAFFITSQYSYDATIISALTAATAYFINIITGDKLNKKDVMSFILLTIWASLPKALYCVFLLLILFVPKENFKDKKQSMLFKLLVFLVFAMILITFVLPAASGEMTGDSRGGNTSVNGQIKYILSNPIAFIKTLVTFSYTTFPFCLLGNKNYAYITYILNGSYLFFVYYIELLLLLYYSYKENMSSKFNIKYKLLFGIEIVGIWLLFCVALYLKYTPVGMNDILGVQPRYLAPVLFCFFSILLPYKKENKENTNDYAYILVSSLCMAFTIILITLKAV